MVYNKYLTSSSAIANIYFAQAMFKNIFEAIVDKISNLNPIRHFIKYALDKTLNEFLKKELTLEDFKNGPLNLHNIEINTHKINTTHLLSSPYILHHGVIGHLKILLPPLSEISTQSIEISVSNIQITLKPNKRFSENFKEKMLELHELKKFYVEEKELEEEISENGTVDFFKELLKKIIMNIKVSVNNIAVKLYMNSPSENKDTPQFYLMLRVPMIYLDKKEDNQIKKNQIEEIKFNILLPQISVHLLREDMRYPDYSNIECRQEDYPFSFPKVSHPSTILLIGSPDVPPDILDKVPEWKKTNSLKNHDFSNFGFVLTTDYAKKTKEFNLSLEIENLEVMTTAVQLKILSRFVVQVMEFKRILDSIIEELKMEVNESVMSLSKKNSREAINNSVDLFSSIMMSLSGDIGAPSLRKKLSNSDNSGSNYYDSMFRQDRGLRQSVRQFNIECGEKLKRARGSESGQFSTTSSKSYSVDEFQAIKFNESQTISIEMNSLRVYVLKYQARKEYKRLWKMQVQEKEFNNKIGCSYFQFSATKGLVNVKVKEKITQVSINCLEIDNVKLHSKKVESSVEDYYDIQNSTDFDEMESFSSNPRFSGNFDSSPSKQTSISYLPELHQFELEESHQHFCIEEIVKVTQQSQKKMRFSNRYKKYSLLPFINHQSSSDYVLYKPAISIHLDKKQNYVKMNIETVAVSLNIEILKDALNIGYPIFCYRRLVDMIQYKRSQMSEMYNSSNSPNGKKNLLESQYECRMEVEEIEEEGGSSNKNILIMDIGEIKFGIRNNLQNYCHANLIKIGKEKVYDEESFDRTCFCSINDPAFYLELYTIQLKKKMNQIKLSCKVLEAGLMELKASEITDLSTVMKINHSRLEDFIKVYKEQINYCDIITLYVPTVYLKISDRIALIASDFVLGFLKNADGLLGYHRYLQNEMSVIEKIPTELSKRPKKSDSPEKELKIFVEQVSADLHEYFTFHLEKIYFHKHVQNSDIIVKVSTIVGGLNRNLKAKICELKNQQMLVNEFPAAKKFGNILNSEVFLQISDPLKTNVIAFKSFEKDTFFDKLEKAIFSVNLRISNRDMDRGYQEKSIMKRNSPSNFSGDKNNNTFSQRFQFKKFNDQSAIQEEGERKIISVNISKPIHLYGCNIIELWHSLKSLEQLIEKLKEKKREGIEELTSQAIIIMERKHSSEIENQSVEIYVKVNKILIDVWPDYIRNQKQRVYSSTRSLIVVDLGDTKIEFKKSVNELLLDTSFSLFWYFLKKEDREIMLNPILLPPLDEICDYGYKNILQIARTVVSLKVESRRIFISLTIKNILAEASISTLILLQLHCDQILKHHVQKKLGMTIEEIYDGDDFCELVYEEDQMLEQDILIIGIEETEQFEVQDLSEALAVYEEKLNLKKKEQIKLKSKPIIYENRENRFITLSSLMIEKMTLRVGKENDFQFIKANGLNISGVTNRIREKQVESGRFLTLHINSLFIKADFGILSPEIKKPDLSQMNVFLQVEKIKVQICKLKNLGHDCLRRLETVIPQQSFTILSNENEICMILEKDWDRFLVKSYALKVKIGVTSEMVSLLKLVKEIERDVERSGWKKIYKNDKNEEKQEKDKQSEKGNKNKSKERLLIQIPQSSIKLSLQYENLMNILDEQIITSSELLLNEEKSNQFAIKNKVRKWMKALIKNNIGSLISRTALNLLIKLISQIIALNVSYIGKFLSLFFNIGGAE